MQGAACSARGRPRQLRRPPRGGRAARQEALSFASDANGVKVVLQRHFVGDVAAAVTLILTKQESNCR